MLPGYADAKAQTEVLLFLAFCYTAAGAMWAYRILRRQL